MKTKKRSKSGKETFPESTVDALIGCTGYKGPRKSLKEMDESIAKGVKSGWPKKTPKPEQR
jgi:hypothetical protein